ncbi:MAG: HAD family hydrolase [Acidobacteriota bacterium]
MSRTALGFTAGGLSRRRRSRAARAPRRGERAGGASGPRAILFDFDGVLVDSEARHWRAFRHVLAPLGIDLSRAAYDERYLAFDDRGALSAMLRDAARSRLPRARQGGARRRPPPLGRLVRRKREAYRRLCGDRVRVGRRAAALVRSLSRRVPLAIVSGAARAEIVSALRRAGISGAFRAVVAAEDVRRCKPQPDGYRLALRRLGLGSGRGCIAVEDSPGGIRAARAAGCEVVGIATSYPAAALRRAGVRSVVRSAASLAPRSLLRAGPPAGQRAS